MSKAVSTKKAMPFPGCPKIARLDEAKLAEAQSRVDALAKPLGSLGRIEEIAVRLSAMSCGLEPFPAIMITVAGDHGVTEEGISPYPQSITRDMVAGFLAGKAAINGLTEAFGMDLDIVDAGCAGGPFDNDKVVDHRLGNGTANFAKGPAMSTETCIQALKNGIGLATYYEECGYRCMGIGEMGIGNTTSASALYCALLGLDPESAVGPGAGASPEMVHHKAEVVRRGLAANAKALSARTIDGRPDALAALACLGGFEIATMAGIVLGAASLGLPVLVDGFISSAAYAAACMLVPEAFDYCFVSHASAEPGHKPAMARLAALAPHPEWGEPLLHLGMHLGEGTGVPLAYNLFGAACVTTTNMATYAEVCSAERT